MTEAMDDVVSVGIEDASVEITRREWSEMLATLQTDGWALIYKRLLGPVYEDLHDQIDRGVIGQDNLDAFMIGQGACGIIAMLKALPVTIEDALLPPESPTEE